MAIVIGTLDLHRKLGSDCKGTETLCIRRMRREFAIMAREAKWPMSTDYGKPISVVACVGRSRGWTVQQYTELLMDGRGEL